MKTILQKLSSLWGIWGCVPKENAQPYYEEIVSLILKKSESTKKSDSSQFLDLADKLISEYKKVVGEGTKNGISWTSSRKVIAERLGYGKLNISNYNEEDIVLATKLYLEDKYTNVMQSERKYCRTLQYFIWKDDGGFKSDLLTYLDKIKNDREQNKDPKSFTEEETNTNWVY